MRSALLQYVEGIQARQTTSDPCPLKQRAVELVSLLAGYGIDVYLPLSAPAWRREMATFSRWTLFRKPIL